MRPFLYSTEAGPESGRFLAGGTTLVDLMKLDVEQPGTLIDVKRANGADALRQIEAGEGGLRLGALVTMAEAADHAEIKSRYPVIAQSLMLAASAQLRNMATLGGNMLQRTRCPYFRDVSWGACNKREPGSGCAARGGYNRLHAVLGTSEACVSSYPGDFAQALIALDAEIETTSRTLPFAQLHNGPDEPQRETVLDDGEMIRSIRIPPGDFRRSLYLKIRDRQSYAFAIASAAVALALDGETVSDSRIALGGVAYKPWRAKEAEAELRGKPFNEANLAKAADAALADAKPLEHNGFKIALAKQTIIRALLAAKALEV